MKLKLNYQSLILLLLTAALACATFSSATYAQSKWKDALHQKADWYGSAEAIRIAENVLLYQREVGGWPKNIDMAKPLSEAERAAIIDQKEQNDALIDNGATYTQMIFLARVFNASGQERFRQAFLKGLDYLLKMQYENGGWPQYYPRLTGYFKHITYNDDALIGVMKLLREVAHKESAYAFVDETRRLKSGQAVQRGIDCILKTQVRVNGKLTVWCAQHDEVTLAPTSARAYEKISLSGFESVGIVRFLMDIEQPGPQIIESIEAAMAWFEQAKLTGLKLVEKRDATLPKGYDRVVVLDEHASPLWARFYEIGTNRPIFCGRDGIIKYSLAEIEEERRNGYRWYVSDPAELLSKDYPAWQKRVGRIARH